MMVSCDLSCPYKSQNGFCRRRVLAIRGGICQFFDKLKRGITEQPLYFENINYTKQEEEEIAALGMNEDECQNECVEEAETADDKDRSNGSQTEETEENGGNKQDNGLD